MPAKQPVEPPAIIYAAKSSEDVRESIPTQVKDAEGMATRQGLTVEGVYTDEAATAYHGSRGKGLVDAREHAEALARERGECSLIVQHTDRLARGDGVAGQHLVEVALWARKAGVRLRSVEDDQTGESLLMAVVMGDRNHEDSRRKGAAVRAGQRRAIERGEWRGGILAAGYAVQRDVDERGRVTRQIVKHPEDAVIFDLIWALAAEGISAQSIELHLGRRGYSTRPVRKGEKPRPFDSTRILKVLNNPFYSGRARWGDELIPGDWPVYVSVEDFQRLKAERETRKPSTQRPVGRPVERVLLSGVARCAVCGDGMHAISRRKWKGDEVIRRRAYICVKRLRHHPGSPDWCAARPVDATTVDRLVLDGLDDLLRDVGDVQEQLRAGHQAELDRLSEVARVAADEVKAAQQKAERAAELLAEGLDTYDRHEREALLRAGALKQREAEEAQRRLTAALDALSAVSQEDEDADSEDIAGTLYAALSGPLRALAGDVKALNMTLREWFAAFYIESEDEKVKVHPLLGSRALGRLRQNGQAVSPQGSFEDYMRLVPPPLATSAQKPRSSSQWRSHHRLPPPRPYRCPRS